MGNSLCRLMSRGGVRTDSISETCTERSSKPGNSNAIESGTIGCMSSQSLIESSDYTRNLAEGTVALQNDNLDLAEQHFASALKVVHVKDPTAQQYRHEVEPLLKLGDIYLKRGLASQDGTNFTKASALYNAAAFRTDDASLKQEIKQLIIDTEILFVKHVIGTDHQPNPSCTDVHKHQLYTLRKESKIEVDKNDEKFKQMGCDKDDQETRVLEAQRVQSLKKVFLSIADGRKRFIQDLVGECITVMGPPPCKYALVGLGSQSTGLVTPYSDVEFAILVEDETEKNLTYFRQLTNYLHLKVINLGETILPAMGIKSLNDYYSNDPLDNWFYDSVTPRGFSFDGAMPKASKTPLGRKMTANHPAVELIHTPHNLGKILEEDALLYLDEKNHLGNILRNVSLLEGDEGLMNEYNHILAKLFDEKSTQISSKLREEMLGDTVQLLKKEDLTAKILDAKKDIYRFPTIALDCIALCHEIIPTSVWETLEAMEDCGVVSAENAHHLGVLLSFSAELRLRTYMANGGQKENLSALSSMSTVEANSDIFGANLNKVFHLPNSQQIFRYYYTAIPLKRFLSDFSLASLQEKSLPNQVPSFFDASPQVKYEMYIDLGDFSKAIMYCEQALEGFDRTTQNREIANALNDMGVSLTSLGDNEKAITYYKEALSLFAIVHGENGVHIETANCQQNIGVALCDKGDYKNSLMHHEEALKMRRAIFGQENAHPDIASSLNELGSVYQETGDFRKAVDYYSQALEMRQSIYGATPHPDTATSLNNIGLAWDDLGDSVKSLNYLMLSLEMWRSVYGQFAAHHHIVNSLNNIGVTFLSFKYLEHALEMCKIIYGDNAAHLVTANTMGHIGEVWHSLEEPRKAISWYSKALQMRRAVVGKSTAHSCIALSLSKLGDAWSDIDVKKAIRYYEQALQIERTIHGESAAHPDIAESLSCLGLAWKKLGDGKKALGYHEMAQKMRQKIYGDNLNHSQHADDLADVASCLEFIGDYDAAVSNYEQALEMYKSIHGENHSKIFWCLCNLGTVCSMKGDERKAISYREQAIHMWQDTYEEVSQDDIMTTICDLGESCADLGDYTKSLNYYQQALKMMKTSYGQNTPHLDIARTLRHIGEAWISLKEERKAIDLFEEALEMMVAMYGTKTPLVDIADIYNCLGVAWGALDEHQKAINFLKKSLQMTKAVYGWHKSHPDICASLNNLGHAWNSSGDHKKAIKLYKKALKMLKTIHGRNTVHPDKAATLTNLGEAWLDLGSQKKAIKYCTRAVDMIKKVYPEDQLAHPDIKKMENFLAFAMEEKQTEI